MKEFTEAEAHQIFKKVHKRLDEILENLDRESIDVYNFLNAEFKKGDVTRNYLFQFVFRSFYRLDNAGLTPEFKSRYFELMEGNRGNKSMEINIEELLKELEKIPRIKENKTEEKKGSFQFTFATKLKNTLDENYPIYDFKVSKAIIGSSYSPAGKFEKKLKSYLSRLEVIRKTYSYIIENESFASIFSDFDKSFPDNGLSDLKKLDFIFWSYGKLL